MPITITAFERSPGGGKDPARDTRVRRALDPSFMRSGPSLISLLLTSLWLTLVGCAAAQPPAPAFTRTPTQAGVVRVAALGAADQPFVDLLGDRRGAMQSGAVSLAPGKSVGAHDTEGYEELLIPLEGHGELRIPGHPAMALTPGMVAYSPPHTVHDVANTGDAAFRYIFVAAPWRP